jgi:hypothetical protein
MGNSTRKPRSQDLDSRADSGADPQVSTGPAPGVDASPDAASNGDTPTILLPGGIVTPTGAAEGMTILGDGRALEGADNPIEPANSPIDLAGLVVSQDFGATLSLSTAAAPIRIGKPEPEWFFRVHPDPAYHQNALILELEADRSAGSQERSKLYLIAGPELQALLMADLSIYPKLASLRLLVLAVTRQGTAFLWPLRVPAEGDSEGWTGSAWHCAIKAKTHWLRMTSNNTEKRYIETIAMDQTGELAWPKLGPKEILYSAFRDRIIDSPDHPVLRRLRGER